MSTPLLALSETDAVQETLLGEALEHAPIGAIVLDEAGRYLAANRTACRLTGYTREELLDAGPHALAADPGEVPAALEQMANGALEHGTASMRCRDGSFIDVEYRVGATRSGGLPYFVFVFWGLAPPAS
jgi:PAS domain S-box-containing protein